MIKSNVWGFQNDQFNRTWSWKCSHCRKWFTMQALEWAYAWDNGQRRFQCSKPCHVLEEKSKLSRWMKFKLFIHKFL